MFLQFIAYCKKKPKTKQQPEGESLRWQATGNPYLPYLTLPYVHICIQPIHVIHFWQCQTISSTSTIRHHEIFFGPVSSALSSTYDDFELQW